MIKIKNAFTLLELLIVIGIIGILVALATVSYSATQKSSRDARRKQDMAAIQNAMEQYYSSNSFKYPVDCGVATIGNSTYMKTAWPADPDASAYIPSNCTATSYCVCALMEKLGSGNAYSDACATTGASKDYYCVSQLQ